MAWPKPKVIHGEVTYYEYKDKGTTQQFTSPKPGAVKKTVETVKLKHWPLYLSLDVNSKGDFGVGVTGTCHYMAHVVTLHCNKKFSPICKVKIAYGWTKQWWKPWKYLYFSFCKPPA